MEPINREGMMPILGWRLWYSDGLSFSDADGSWDEAPDQDVQILEYLHESPYRTLDYGLDEYRLTPDHPVKLGAYMGDLAYYALVNEVVAGE